MPELKQSSIVRRTTGAKLLTVLSALLLAGACGDDGPTYPDTFDPLAVQQDMEGVNASLNAPASEAFGAMGPLIDNALAELDGGGPPLLIETPALLLDGPLNRTQARSIATRLKRSASVKQASAIPPAALGATFEYDPESGEYFMGEEDGAPANGVRFILYEIDDDFGEPAVPLVEVGHVDLTRTSNSNSVQGRVEVYNNAANAVKVLDYTARMSGTVSEPRFEIEGFARNGSDRMDFTLVTRFVVQTDEMEIDWRAEVDSHDLVTRLEQEFIDDADPRIVIDAMVSTPSGRIDLDGTINDETGGTIAVKVNGETFATMEFASGQSEPVIENADGEPLTADEEDTLHQVFEYFGNAMFLFIVLLAPMSTVLDIAF